jgi:GntR family transcriptional repressor for pyruvate dehydrogenase complex
VSTSTTSTLSLEAIPRDRIFTRVAEQLQVHILNNLKPGDMLPSERELVRTFRVSRTSIRDAIRSLEAIGLLEPRQGIGTVVREFTVDAIATPVTGALLQKKKAIDELLDVRTIIEPALARRAALYATPEQIAEMQTLLERQAEKVRRGEPATEEDSNFHYTIALAANNSVVLKVVHVLMDLLREMRERSLEVGGRPEKSLAGHLRIFAAIQKRQPAAAEAAMHRHLIEIKRIILPML